jgi:hypothetical protein
MEKDVSHKHILNLIKHILTLLYFSKCNQKSKNSLKFTKIH